VPIILGYSSAICPRPPDYPAHAHIVGALAAPSSAAEELPPAVAAFLERRRAAASVEGGAVGQQQRRIVVFSFGSMLALPDKPGRGAALLRACADAAASAGCAALVCYKGQEAWLAELRGNGDGGGGGDSGGGDSEKAQLAGKGDASDIVELPALPNVLFFRALPYAQLYKAVDAVVCHGGAGTVHAAIQAGRPVLVVPFDPDSGSGKGGGGGVQSNEGTETCAKGVTPSSASVLASPPTDQPYWGGRVSALKIGPEPVHVDRISARRLKSELATLLGPRKTHQVVRRSESLARLSRAPCPSLPFISLEPSLTSQAFRSLLQMHERRKSKCRWKPAPMRPLCSLRR
jgi:UDP:flavonoid glycosyltransferase YjiC (YdhE family)